MTSSFIERVRLAETAKVAAEARADRAASALQSISDLVRPVNGLQEDLAEILVYALKLRQLTGHIASVVGQLQALGGEWAATGNAIQATLAEVAVPAVLRKR